jgi:serine/threonine protein kinase
LQVVGGVLTTHGRKMQVAVKRLPDVTAAVTRERFDAELKAHQTAQQAADGVCRLIGTCVKNGTMCIVMKRYVGNLRGLITAGIEVGEVRRIAHSLCCTLEQLHAAGVVVKDIKPENVLMDEYGKPVLADFGISAVVTSTTRIMPTSIQGTFSYMAPELFETGGFGPEVDVWAMGCVVVEMCTGEAPFAGLQMAQIMRAVCDRHVAPTYLATLLPPTLSVGALRSTQRRGRPRPSWRLRSLQSRWQPSSPRWSEVWPTCSPARWPLSPQSATALWQHEPPLMPSATLSLLSAIRHAQRVQPVLQRLNG